MSFHVAVIGGGITGMSAAYYLQKQAWGKKRDLTFTLIEASSQLGGKIQTVVRDRFVIERGPDSIIKRKVEGYQLIKELGLEDDVVSNKTGKSYILKGGQLHPIPEGTVMGVPTHLNAIDDSTLFSPEGKKRAALDLEIPRGEYGEDVSVGHFFRRRLGDEVVDHLISPLLSGIYAGNIDHLSLKTVLPQFLETEKKYGSLIKGLSQGQAHTQKPSKSAKKEGQFITLRKGISSLVEALEAALTGGEIKKAAQVTKVVRGAKGYLLTLDNGEMLTADAIIFTIPHPNVAALLPDAPYLVQKDRDKSTSVATVALAFPEDRVKLEKEGTGFLVSRKEPMSITATTWTNQKWPHTVPKGKTLLRCYVGRAGDDDIINKSDKELVEIVLRDLKTVTKIDGEPDFAVVSRWHEAMPQYQVGHQAWLKEVAEKLPQDYPNVYVAGASFNGIGIPDCIKQGKEAAEMLFSSVESKLKTTMTV